MKSELIIFQEWIDYLENICAIDDCGYSLDEAEAYINFSKHIKDENIDDLALFVNHLEITFGYYQLEFTPWKIFRRKKIIENVKDI